MATYNARVRHKRDTSANWHAQNPVLLDGEIIIVDTSAGDVRIKIGDGVRTYRQLPFSDEAMQNLVDSKQNKLVFDAEPTEGSTNPVVSDGVFAALSNKQDRVVGAPGEFVVVGADGNLTTSNDVKYDVVDANAVKFTEQTLTEEQKAQARENIGAGTESNKQVVGTDVGAKCAEFSSLFKDSTRVESFIFFTDPHLLGGAEYEVQLLQYIDTLEACYNSTPTSFVLCGGDWLELHSRAEACFRLGYVDGLMRSKFNRFYTAVGNHDYNTNMSGIVYDEDEDVNPLVHQTIKNLLFHDERDTYYSFDGTNTKFYVLDTGGTGWWEGGAFIGRWWEQIEWLGTKLKADDADNSAIILHISYEMNSTTGELYVTPFASKIFELCQAYNEKTTIALNGVEYDFTGCTGRVRFALTGHKHNYEQVTVVNGIPVVLTSDMRHGNKETFDLCFVDYDKDLFHMVRIGSGGNRTVDISYGPNYTNQIPTSIATDGSVYNGIGYKPNTRIGTGTGAEVTHASYSATGFIPCVSGDTVRFSGIERTGEAAVSFWSSDFKFLAASYLKDEHLFSPADNNGVSTSISNTFRADTAYIRFTGNFDNAIVTVNEKIS